MSEMTWTDEQIDAIEAGSRARAMDRCLSACLMVLGNLDPSTREADGARLCVEAVREIASGRAWTCGNRITS